MDLGSPSVPINFFPEEIPFGSYLKGIKRSQVKICFVSTVHSAVSIDPPVNDQTIIGSSISNMPVSNW